MAAKSKVIALLSACLSLGTAAGVAALAIGGDRAEIRSVDAAEACPPGACTIVVKTAVGGPPSVMHDVPMEASVPARPKPSSPILLAATERAD